MAENNLQLLVAKRGFGKAGLRLAVAVVVSFGQSVKIRVNKLPRIRADESELDTLHSVEPRKKKMLIFHTLRRS